MREVEIENYLDSEVQKHGGFTRKLNWYLRRSAPDRLVFLKRIYFIELKAPGKRPTKQQAHEHELIRSQGGIVLIIDTKSKVDYFIKHATRIQAEITTTTWVKSLS